jgi:hypothetical protein
VKTAVAYCYRPGRIRFGQRCPKGAIVIATGPRRLLREAIEPLARLAYDGRSLLVPGVPEADDERAAALALALFRTRLRVSVQRRREKAVAELDRRFGAFVVPLADERDGRAA